MVMLDGQHPSPGRGSGLGHSPPTGHRSTGIGGIGSNDDASFELPLEAHDWTARKPASLGWERWWLTPLNLRPLWTA